MHSPAPLAQEIHLKSRPAGLPTLGNFEQAETRLAPPQPGQALVRNLWISVDPYMRGRMVDRESYIPPFQLGQALDGAAVGIVEQSADPALKAGDLVAHFAGWRSHALIDAATAMKIDADPTGKIPVQAYLGALGFPGLTAYAGLKRIAKLQRGETVFVSAASGAVGSLVAQIAKLMGARVIATAGSADKVQWLKDELGVDVAINYRDNPDLGAALAAAAPEGIDVYFDNVGGNHLEAALTVANPKARFILCGMISGYNTGSAPVGPANIFLAVEKRITLQGMLVSDHVDLMPDFLRDMSGWISGGRVKLRDTIVDGLENAPEAFIGLFEGANVGKMLVRLG
ncbi:NADP-dependent oxidoreductase [Pararhizobium sp.]|uniref:NADP-dependent oxidoreductase n=1 Tax=Pararhizobium sp. TaxID=1977563 RepID=UPI003D0B42E6